MSTRIVSAALTRPLVFRPYTSAVPIASGADAFEYRLPLLEEGDNWIDEEKSRWPKTKRPRYIYVFLRKEAMGSGSTWDQVMARFAIRQASGGEGENPLIVGFVLGADGTQKAMAGADIRVGDLSAETVEVGEPEFPVEDLDAAQQLSLLYAVASPTLLTQGAIESLEKAKPDTLPDLGDGVGWLIAAKEAATPAQPKWAAPVVDPLLITENLTKQYMAACDAYLAHTQSYEKPNAQSEGELRLLKKGVADTLVGIAGSQPLTELVEGQPDDFLADFSERTAELADLREAAALNLLRWIESDLMNAAENWFREADGTLSDSYSAYAYVMGNAMSRLAESTRGVTYLAGALERSKDPAKNGKPGVMRFINEMVLPDERYSDKHIELTYAAAEPIFAVWSAFFNVLQALVAQKKTSVRVGTKVVQVSELKDSVVIMTKRWEMWLNDDLMKMPKRSPATIEYEVAAPVRVPVRVNKTVRVEVEFKEPRITLSPGAKAALKKVAIATERAEAVISILNLTLTYCAMREALHKDGNASDQLKSVLDFSTAMVDLASHPAAAHGLSALRAKLLVQGAVEARGLGAKAITGRLGLLSSGISLVSAGTSAMDNYAEGDWDAVAANVTEGVGEVITGTGYLILINSPESGPFAGWFLLGGAVVSLGGFLWATVAEDLPLEQALKHCAFGKQAGAADTAPGWALCKSGTFSDWNPKTAAGLRTQLKAFEQLFYCFQASGVKDAPDTLRIYPASLREDSVFHIQYTARYYTDLPRDVPQGDPARAGLQIVGHCTVHVHNLSLVTVDGDPLEYQVNGKSVVERKKVKVGEGADDRDVIDVRFIPSMSGPKRDDIPRFPGKESLICNILLAPHGDGGMYGDKASLSVPNSVGGARRLGVVAVDGRKPRDEKLSSTTEGELS